MSSLAASVNTYVELAATRDGLAPLYPLAPTLVRYTPQDVLTMYLDMPIRSRPAYLVALHDGTLELRAASESPQLNDGLCTGRVRCWMWIGSAAEPDSPLTLDECEALLQGLEAAWRAISNTACL